MIWLIRGDLVLAFLHFWPQVRLVPSNGELGAARAGGIEIQWNPCTCQTYSIVFRRHQCYRMLQLCRILWLFSQYHLKHDIWSTWTKQNRSGGGVQHVWVWSRCHQADRARPALAVGFVGATSAGKSWLVGVLGAVACYGGAQCLTQDITYITNNCTDPTIIYYHTMLSLLGLLSILKWTRRYSKLLDGFSDGYCGDHRGQGEQAAKWRRGSTSELWAEFRGRSGAFGRWDVQFWPNTGPLRIGNYRWFHLQA